MNRFADLARAFRSSRFARTWLHSDLIGIPFTLTLIGILLASLAVFKVAGNLGGMMFAVLCALVFGGLFFLSGGEGEETMDGVEASPEDGAHRVLVIANLGLEEPALCAEVCARGTRADTEAMIVAPVVASRLRTLTDDNLPAMEIGEARVAVALATLEREGITASGHAAPGEPMNTLLDGLREFHASEVVMLDGGEADWEDASAFAERVRQEVGIRVTEVSPGSDDGSPQKPAILAS